MPLQPGDVKLIPPLEPTYGDVNGQAVPVFKIHFTFRGTGSYSVLVPRDGYTGALGLAAVRQEAEQIALTFDTPI